MLTFWHYSIDGEYRAVQESILDSLHSRSKWQDLVRVADASDIVDRRQHSSAMDSASSQESSFSARQIAQSVQSSFLLIDRELDDDYLPDTSGTTASTIFLYPNHIVIAHVGDSRIVLCCDSSEGLAIQLTKDHTPYDKYEAMAVNQLGGEVIGNTKNGESLRVNGKLAVTRSVGDSQFGEVISPKPDILTLSLNNVHAEAIPSTSSRTSSDDTSICQRYRDTMEELFGQDKDLRQQLFIIMASDGLWDVMSNQEACELVCRYLLTAITASSGDHDDAMHHAAKLVAQEAFIRGSSDNIGVLVIDLLFADSKE